MEDARSTIMIKREFQHNLMLQTVLSTFITLNVIIILGFYVSDVFSDDDSMFDKFPLVLAGLEVIGVAGVYFISQRISFRIAGPVYAIERTLRSIQEGDLMVFVKLRPGDSFMEAADTINDTTSGLRERMLEMKSVVAGIESTDPGIEKLRDLLAYYKTVEAGETDAADGAAKG
ncbi:MAG: methyl-accepting chemotaxis protein [Halieaceae bacterium]|jgi:methyl-accepting chemotaxis protein